MKKLSQFYRIILSCVFFCFISFIGINNVVGQTSDYQTSTSNRYFTVPAGVTSITIECWGAGGGGGYAASRYKGCGGGGGGAYAKSVITVSQGDIFYVTVGSGGGSGSAGGESYVNNTNSFGTTRVKAAGGAGVSNNTEAGGAGGTVGNSIGDIRYRGGTGGAGSHNDRQGGGGGGAAGQEGNGENGYQTTESQDGWGEGNDGTRGLSGRGGRGGYNNTYKEGARGEYYGGGGGGGRTYTGTNNTGGSGADGFVRISYTVVSVTANTDYAVFDYDSPAAITINVTDNDDFTNCTVSSVSVASNPSYGTAVVNGTNIIYTPNPTPQSDSFTYTITSGPLSSTATVYILALNTESDKYIACENKQISLVAITNPNFTFKWYDAASEGNNLYTGDTYLFTKNGNADETVYLQAVGADGINVGSRKAVLVQANDFCGEITEGNCNGTVLFFEDFGGNSIADPMNGVFSQLHGHSDLTFAANPGLGSYGLVKIWHVDGQTWVSTPPPPSCQTTNCTLFLPKKR